MKLRGWHIAGFGTLVDWRQEDLSGGLNVFYGPNEAGKSTLLAFLRFALFGFRPGNTRDLKYPPPPGIHHGGTVYLEDRPEQKSDLPTGTDHFFSVERIANAGRGGKRLRVERANGEEAPEAELARLMGHADRDLFNNVFAFSLTELQSLESLTEKGVQDHIFSAGITGAGRSARDALEEIRKESDELFKGKAKTRVSLLVDEIAKLDDALRAGRERARGYPELADRELDLAAKLEALRADIETRRRQSLRARKLCDLWREVYGPLIENRRQLEGLAAHEGFGADARTVLDACTSSLARAREQVESTQREARAVSASFEKLTPDPKALAVREEVLALERDLGLYESKCKEVVSSEQNLVAHETGFRNALADLGPDWDEARLRETHVSMSVTDEALRFEERFRAARDQVRDCERKLRDGKERLVELAEQRAQEITARDQAPASNDPASEQDVSSAELDRRAATLRGLQAELARRSTLEMQIESAQALIGAAQRGNAGRLGAGRLRRVWVAAAVLGAGVAAVLFANNGFRFASDPLFVAAIATLLFGALGAALTRESHAARPEVLPDLDSLESDLASLNEDLSRSAAAFGIPTPPAAEDVEAATVALERARAIQADREQRKLQIDRLDAQRGRVEATLGTLASSTETAKHELEALDQEWAQWGESVGLPPSVAPRSVERFAGEVKTARAHLDARDEALSSQGALFDWIDGWARRVRGALVESSEDPPPRVSDARGEPNLIPAFTKLVRRVRDAEERERQRPDVERALADAQEREADFAAREDRAREQLTELFAQVGASDREEYLARLADFEHKIQLEAKVREQSAELARRIGLGEEADELRAELETGRVGEWEAQAGASDAEIANLQAESDEVVRTHRDVENEIKELHGSNDLGALELNRATLQQELSEGISRWRELQIARGLIERTLERFERERQPAVLQEASHHFARVTGGRYPRIVQTAELGSFSVVDVNGERKTPDELSRGTAEQLYVCIRLGLIAEFCRRARQLPIAMDDVLVNFDDDRALAMAQVLADFSQRNDCQVLVFTCSSRTRDLFRQAAPEALHLEFDLPANARAQ